MIGHTQILEKEYYAWCRQQCADIIKVYTKCREDAGLAMIFKCREEQRVTGPCCTTANICGFHCVSIRLQAIGECVAPFSKDAARMQAFKDARIAEIVEKGIGAAADPKE